MTINLENTIWNWLWSCLVDQNNFEDKKFIYPEKEERESTTKDFITFNISSFNYNALATDVDIKSSTEAEITEYKTYKISLFYQGKFAFNKLEKIIDNIRFSEKSDEFLAQFNANSEILNIIDISKSLNNIQINEAASSDLSFSILAKRVDIGEFFEIAKVDDIVI